MASDVTYHVGVWPSLDPRSYAWPKKQLPFPLAEENCRLYALGRHALWNGVRTLGLEPGQAVLVPSLHHGSEVEALRRANLECVFYPLNDSWEPDLERLEELLDERVRALHLIHYLGFPQDLDMWRSWCDEKGILLIEDAAQSFQATSGGRPVGSVGDLAIFCLYKSYGLPDGAAAIVRQAPPDLPHSAGRAGVKPLKLLLRHGAWIGQYSRSMSAAQRTVRRLGSTRQQTQDDEKEFALGDPSSPPSAATSYLLPRVVSELGPERRRDHYAALTEILGGFVVPAFRRLPEGASPFALPISSPNPEFTVDRLRSRDVNCIRFWTFPHPAFPVGVFPQADAVRGSTVILPVHQELTRASIERIGEEVLRVMWG